MTLETVVIREPIAERTEDYAHKASSSSVGYSDAFAPRLACSGGLRSNSSDSMDGAKIRHQAKQRAGAWHVPRSRMRGTKQRVE
ncbi:hypothetical protein GQ600_19701 [Phytophthora cactorum]|nr:hypothetical protein GQ600_19701 [Phytophthora cactorum]